MKSIVILFGIYLITGSFFAQVGIGNTDPKSILDISASNQVTPSNTDGILIPRVDAFPATNPTADQHGMLIFLTTTDNGDTPGFYYWNFPTLSWIGFNSNSAEDNITVVNIEDFLFDAYSGAKGPMTQVSNDNQYAFTPAATSGATSTIETDATGNDYMGKHTLLTGTGTNGAAAIASSDWEDKIRIGGYELSFEMRVRFTVASASAGTCVGTFGLSNLQWINATTINTHTSADGIYFKYSSAGIVGKCRGSSLNSVTSAISANAGQWYKLKAVINAAGTSVDFYVDGVSLGTVTTNIPSNTLGMKLLGVMEKINSGSTVFGADIDYVTWRMSR